MPRTALVVFTLITVATFAVPSRAATAFMYIDGVAGNSPTDKTHTDWIDLTKFIAPVQSAQPPTLGGLGPSLGDIIIGKKADAASVALMNAAANGTVIQKVKIDYCDNCQKNVPPQPSDIFFVGEWTFEMAEFADLTIIPPPGDPSPENYSFNFNSSEYQYSEQDKDGNKKDGSYKAGWPDPTQPPNTSTEGSPTGPFMLLNEFIIPEPATAVMLAWGLLMTGIRRRS